jgi:hypothetical protein
MVDITTSSSPHESMAAESPTRRGGGVRDGLEQIDMSLPCFFRRCINIDSGLGLAGVVFRLVLGLV